MTLLSNSIATKYDMYKGFLFLDNFHSCLACYLLQKGKLTYTEVPSVQHTINCWSSHSKTTLKNDVFRCVNSIMKTHCASFAMQGRKKVGFFGLSICVKNMTV